MGEARREQDGAVREAILPLRRSSRRRLPLEGGGALNGRLPRLRRISPVGGSFTTVPGLAQRRGSFLVRRS